MQPAVVIAIYSVFVVFSSLLGGFLPAFIDLTHRRMQFVMSGIGGFMLGIMLARSVFAGHFEDHDHFGFEAASWYWHFVDVVWVMLFLFVYIL